MSDRTLKAQFDNAHGRRSGVMRRCRECAALTIPSVLPEVGINENSDILKPYQSLGSGGVANLTNKLLLALYPVGTPWWRFAPSAKLFAAAQISDGAQAQLRAVEQALYTRELLVMRVLDNARLRTRKRTCIENLIVVGNALSMLTDEYTLKSYRLDQYVQKRASDGTWLWLITHERVDPLQLSDEILARAEISREDAEKVDDDSRGLDLYTRAERRRNGGFIIRQEINGHIVLESEEPVSRYFPSGYVELPGEDYSRGFIEERTIGALRSYNGLWKALLDGTVAATNLQWFIDESSGWKTRDLTAKTGSVHTGGIVREGMIPGIACLQLNKQADLQVAQAALVALKQDLSSAMLMESAMTPQQDRVTATQVLRLAQEIEGATGGVYSHISEEEQHPLIERVTWQMKKDKLLPPLPKEIEEEVQIDVLTGIEALGRMRKAEAVRGLMQDIGQNPQLMRYIKPQWMLDAYLQAYTIDTRAATKSDEEVKAEDQAAMQQQMQAMMAQQAVQSGGKIVENAASAPAPAMPAMSQ